MARKQQRKLGDAIQETLAIATIGDGVVVALMPESHFRLWEFGPRWYRRPVEVLKAHPNVMRLVGIAEIVGGVCWARMINARYAR